jgi:hypothetical protein
MRKLSWLFIASMAVLAAACGRSNSPAIDDALKNDLTLASQAQPTQQFVSAAEGGYAPQQQYAAPRAIHTAARTTPVRRTSTVRRSSGSSSSGNYPAQEPPTTTVKHTGRDAAIGAAAGAVIGATTSRDKVKGGLIGAAVGGILGGVIGNNVDIQKKIGW